MAKFSGSGVHLWSQRFGSNGTDRGQGVVVDSNGNVVVTGLFGQNSGGTVDFDPANNPGGELTSAGLDDIFVAKFSGAGAHQWSKRFGDTSS